MVPSVTPPKPIFSLAALFNRLRDLPQPARYWLAYSGGLDSHVLLHAMVALRDQGLPPLQAIHIQHGLQSAADAWARHCQAICKALDVPLHIEHLHLLPQVGTSLEALARTARYTAIQRLAPPQTMLLTAQHQDDQAETVLLQLLRGAGIAGLAAMPDCVETAYGWHARPCLADARQALREYAVAQDLHWVEDPSNQDTAFDRNYLRQEIMPRLQTRWPAAATTIARSAGLLADLLPTINTQVAQDLAACCNIAGRVQINRLLNLPQVRRQQVVRAWIQQAGHAVPSQAQLYEMTDKLLVAAADAQPQVAWGDTLLRRYQGQLWLQPRAMPSAPSLGTQIVWPDQQMALELPPGCGRLHRQSATQGIPDRYWQQDRVSVRWRVPGVRCRPQGRQGTRSFKKLCQTYAIPPWQRPYVPLVYVQERLVAVADYCLCDIQSIPGDTFSQIGWQKAAYFR